MSHRLLIPTMLVIGSALLRSVDARTDPVPEFRQDSLQPLDARVEDVGVLSTSLRVESAGLARPSGFESVYRVPGGSDKLMRVDGALFAIFDQSVYLKGSAGVQVPVPPSTVFHIGAPPQRFETPDAPAPATSKPAGATTSGSIGYGVVPPALPGRARPSSAAGEAGGPGSLPRFLADPSYRSRRLAEILESHLARSPSNDD